MKEYITIGNGIQKRENQIAELVQIACRYESKVYLEDEARKINNIREKYLSCILPEILKRYSKKDAIFNDLENKKFTMKLQFYRDLFL